MRRFVAPVLFGLLSACATMHGPQTITLSTAEVERLIQIDLGGVVGIFKGFDVHRPKVSLMPVSERLLLEWNFTLPDGPTGSPVGVVVEISGKPVLNPPRNGIDLTQAQIEDVRLDGLLRFLSLARLVDLKGATLPDLPLVTLPPDRLRQSNVVYVPTGVAVGFTGLKVDIVPR